MMSLSNVTITEKDIFPIDDNDKISKILKTLYNIKPNTMILGIPIDNNFSYCDNMLWISHMSQIPSNLNACYEMSKGYKYTQIRYIERLTHNDHHNNICIRNKIFSNGLVSADYVPLVFSKDIKKTYALILSGHIFDGHNWISQRIYFDLYNYAIITESGTYVKLDMTYIAFANYYSSEMKLVPFTDIPLYN